MAVMVALTLAALLLQQPETLSLLGEPLYPYKLSKSARSKADDDLRAAHAAYEKAPNDVPAILALSAAHLAFGRIGDSIEVLTHGLETNTDDARLLLARGIDYIGIRKFDVAQRDLRKAVEKLPEAHCALGFAQYLTGAFPHAQASYAQCDDPGVFGYLSARRGGASAQRPAVVRPPAAGEEIRLPGSTSPKPPRAEAPLATRYLDAADLLLAGKSDEATARLKDIVRKHRNQWLDPAYIAAEADYARLYKPPRKKKR